jgi:hypothetical protein
MGTKKTKPATTKRGRGRPSALNIAYDKSQQALIQALDFIRSLNQNETEEWLGSNGYLTYAQVYADEQKAAAEKRERLEREIEERKAELRALEGQG